MLRSVPTFACCRSGSLIRQRGPCTTLQLLAVHGRARSHPSRRHSNRAPRPRCRHGRTTLWPDTNRRLSSYVRSSSARTVFRHEKPSAAGSAPSIQGGWRDADASLDGRSLRRYRQPEHGRQLYDQPRFGSMRFHGLSWRIEIRVSGDVPVAQPRACPDRGSSGTGASALRGEHGKQPSRPALVDSELPSRLDRDGVGSGEGNSFSARKPSRPPTVRAARVLARKRPGLPLCGLGGDPALGWPVSRKGPSVPPAVGQPDRGGGAGGARR